LLFSCSFLQKSTLAHFVSPKTLLHLGLGLELELELESESESGSGSGSGSGSESELAGVSVNTFSIKRVFEQV